MCLESEPNRLVSGLTHGPPWKLTENPGGQVEVSFEMFFPCDKGCEASQH